MAYNIPKRITESIDRYVENKIPTGGFLRAVLENDFVNAVCRADDECKECLVEIAKYVYNEIPARCWGSPEKVRNWLSAKEEA